jgi:hypothetical protein
VETQRRCVSNVPCRVCPGLQIFEKEVLVGWKMRLNMGGAANGKQGDPSLDHESAYDGDVSKLQMREIETFHPPWRQ